MEQSVYEIKMAEYALFPIISFLWAGMILGISCLEAWVKFKTPSLTKIVGLDVGRTVFSAFHGVQCGILSFLIICMLFFSPVPLYFLIPTAIAGLLGLQIFLIFPPLSETVTIALNQGTITKSRYHLWYACLELVKLCLLLGNGLFFISLRAFMG